jgi:hypothetical protein
MTNPAIATYVSVLLPVTAPAYTHSRYVRCVCQQSGAGLCLSICLAAPRGAVDIYACVVIMFWYYLTTTGNALLVKAIYVIHLSMYGPPASPPCCLVRP